MTTDTAVKFNLTGTLRKIRQRLCPCHGCKGQLGSSDRPSWSRCQECRCWWKIDDEIVVGKLYAAYVRGNCEEER